MRLALRANPESGGSTDTDALEQRLRALGAELVEEADAERLVVAGGDGSVAPAAERAGELGVPLAVLPTGTANDFARATGLPEDLDEAVRRSRFAAIGVRTLDLGRKDGRPFVNACSAGLAVDAARAASGMKKTARPAGLRGRGGARRRDRVRRCTCRVTCDEHEVFDGDAWQVIVAGTGHFGAGSHLAAAEDDDGELELAIVPAGSRLRLVQHAYGLRTGRLTCQRGVVHARGARIRMDGRLAFNLDGELTDPATADVHHRPGAPSGWWCGASGFARRAGHAARSHAVDARGRQGGAVAPLGAGVHPRHASPVAALAPLDQQPPAARCRVERAGQLREHGAGGARGPALLQACELDTVLKYAHVSYRPRRARICGPVRIFVPRLP